MQVHGAFHSLVDPTPTLTKPYLVAASDGMATTLGLSPQQLRRQEFAEVFSGNGALPAIEGCVSGSTWGKSASVQAAKRLTAGLAAARRGHTVMAAISLACGQDSWGTAGPSA